MVSKEETRNKLVIRVCKYLYVYIYKFTETEYLPHDILDISSQNVLRSPLFWSHKLVYVLSELREFICRIMFEILLQKKNLGNQDFKLNYCMSK